MLHSHDNRPYFRNLPPGVAVLVSLPPVLLSGPRDVTCKHHQDPWPAGPPPDPVSWAAMLRIRYRVRYSTSGVMAARLFSSRPARNPVVFLDIEADSEPLGRITIEVAGSFAPPRCSSTHTYIYSDKRTIRLNTHACIWMLFVLSCSWMQMSCQRLQVCFKRVFYFNSAAKYHLFSYICLIHHLNKCSTVRDLLYWLFNR